MSVPRSLTVSELINTINDLVITQRRRPTVDEVIEEVLARAAARLEVSPKQPKPPTASVKPEKEVITPPSPATFHVKPPPALVKLKKEVITPPNPLTSYIVGPSRAGTSPPVEYSGKHYAVIRGRCVGVFPEPFDYVKLLVDGVPHNFQRGFKSRQAAVTYYHEEKARGVVRVIRTSTRDDEVFGAAEVGV